MKTWTGALSVTSALFLAFACADDDHPTPGETGGAGGEAGRSSETGGTASTGGSQTTGGSSNNGGAGAEGGAGDQGGAGGAPITCEPPEPPSVSGGDAGGAGGAAGAGGVSSVGGSGSDLGGGGGSGGESATGALAIEGSYVDEYMGHHVVTSSAWTSSGAVYHISAFNNAQHWVVARNDQANGFFPCLWSRFDWTEKGGVLYYCTTAYNAESEEAALAAPAANASDPEATGCGNFPWTSLTAE